MGYSSVSGSTVPLRCMRGECTGLYLCEWEHRAPTEMYEREMRWAIALWVRAQCPGGDVRERNALGYTKLCELEHRAVADARILKTFSPKRA